MADKISSSPIKSVRVDALVVLKICKHASNAHPAIVTGQLLGMDVDNELQITNSFPFPDMPSTGEDSASGAAAAPRSKNNTHYQSEMVRCLREMNVDANTVGWYQSANLGNFLNSNFIENQYFYQSPLNERTVAIVHDTARSTAGALSLHAYRLTPAFMAAQKEGKFTLESLAKHNLTYRDILVEIPLTIHNSHLVTTLLHQLDTPPTAVPLSVSDISATSLPLYPNFDSLDLSVDPFLEKHCDLLLESIESHYSEVNNQQYYSRQLAREQAKITAWQSKRKQENMVRSAAKQPLLPEDEWQRLFKLPQEPSRLETLLVSRQIEQYARQVDGFAAVASAKMFAANQGLVRTEDN
ncbi:eukaryotic translation initiation factor 3 subunit H [Ascodesmis nigricans]|uniref:Eukaryotic translation initiation factor 3 subunit H n=1 Tax=Ascodesmis nigricans TaxID=341454 RepID=A0A4V3SJT5_9PEZI|nr:eukaryotic translation initiation factor 3 subunit H [Ascodesmis nigricans]